MRSEKRLSDPVDLPESEVDWEIALAAYQETAGPGRSLMRVRRMEPFVSQEKWYQERNAEESKIIYWSLECLARMRVESISTVTQPHFGGYRMPCRALTGNLLGWLQFWVTNDGYVVFYYQPKFTYVNPPQAGSSSTESKKLGASSSKVTK